MKRPMIGDIDTPLLLRYFARRDMNIEKKLIWFTEVISNRYDSNKVERAVPIESLNNETKKGALSHPRDLYASCNRLFVR